MVGSPTWLGTWTLIHPGVAKRSGSPDALLQLGDCSVQTSRWGMTLTIQTSNRLPSFLNRAQNEPISEGQEGL